MPSAQLALKLMSRYEEKNGFISNANMSCIVFREGLHEKNFIQLKVLILVFVQLFMSIFE